MEDEKKWTVYVHENKINGKRYVGITCQKPEDRWKNGGGYRGQFFYKAIMKYGWDNFKHELVSSSLTKDDAENLEIDLIKKLKSNNRKYGYNISNGGNSNGKHTHETRKKISLSNKGKMITEETRTRLILSHKGKMCGEDNPFYGEKHSSETIEKIREFSKKRVFTKETREKMSKSRTGKILSEKTKLKIKNSKKYNVSYNAVPVVCDGMEFSCIVECADIYGIKRSTMYGWVTGECKIPKEWYDRGLKIKDSNIILDVQRVNDDRCVKVVVNYTMYNSIVQCAKEYGVHRESIRKWLSGKRRMPQKYIDLGLRYATQEEIDEYIASKEVNKTA